MSPTDDGSKRVYRDLDGFFRDERGLKHMAHLLSFVAGMMGVAFGIAAIGAMIAKVDGWTTLVQVSFGLLAGGSVLEGYQTHTEGKNQRESAQQ